MMRYDVPAIAIPIPPKWSVATKRRYNSSLFFFMFIMMLYVSVWRQSRCLLSQKANTSSLPDKSPVWPPYRANLIKGYQQRFWCQKAGLRGRIGDCQYNGVRREGYSGESILYRRKKTPHCGVSSEIGRRERIRTSDPLVPNQLRYQAALLADFLLFTLHGLSTYVHVNINKYLHVCVVRREGLEPSRP